MKILAIDPGTQESAAVILNTDTHTLLFMEIVPNEKLLTALPQIQADLYAIEWIESYGMAVGEEVFKTVFWTGRFRQALSMDVLFIPRKQVKLFLCGASRAKDSNVRQAVIDHFSQIHRMSNRDVIGTKKKPGPLFGTHDDLWAAVAVALTAAGAEEDRSVKFALVS